MSLQKIYAQLNCTDIEASACWYRKLFGRSHNVEPMVGLNEWHHGDCAGFQLADSAEKAGQGSVTMIVSDLSGEYERLVKAGLEVGEITTGDFASFVRISDPDGNSVVLAEPNAKI